MDRPLRIAVVSPFLDKRHGTERCVAEQVEILASDHECEIVIYSQSVTDLCLSECREQSQRGQITWRRVADVPGPHLLRFIWWFFANHAVRYFDYRVGRFRPDLVYSPGTNCVDADVIGVHIVFAEFYAQVGKHVCLLDNPLWSWPRLLHRKAYYRLVMALERHIYRKEHILLAGVADKVALDLKHSYGRQKGVSVIYHGANEKTFNPEVMAHLRSAARKDLGLAESDYALLLAGNDWKKKGLATLLGAVARIRNPLLFILIRGQDDPTPFRALLHQYDLEKRILFLPLRPDVEWYYAAADAYIGPSLEDSFALPPLEAMACGLPVVVSRQAGVSEIVTHDQDGLILEDAKDINQLAYFIERLASDSGFCRRLGSNAARTALRYTWKTNADQLLRLFRDALSERGDIGSSSNGRR